MISDQELTFEFNPNDYIDAYYMNNMNSPRCGYFSLIQKLDNNVVRTQYSSFCRETFGSYFQRNGLIGFSKKNLNIDKLNEFWEKLEDKLKLKTRTVFYRTTENNRVVIKLSNFWFQNKIRRGFCTLFLRCGAVYYKGNFKKALLSYHLLARIKRAVTLFLSGKTCGTHRTNSLMRHGGQAIAFFTQQQYDEKQKKYVRQNPSDILITES